MTYKDLLNAGWLAMMSAFFTVPLAYFSFILEGRVDSEAINAQVFMQIFGTVLFVALTFYLKKLLNKQYQFHDVDKNIALLVLANIIAGMLVITELYIPQLKENISIAVIIIMIIQGVVQFQFGYKMQILENDLGGMLKPYCYLNMITGICVASIVLILVGVVTSAVSDLMLGTIFFTLSRPLKAPDTEK